MNPFMSMGQMMNSCRGTFKQVEADEQAIQNILLGRPKDIYVAVSTIAQPGMNMGQDRQMQMVGGNGRIRLFKNVSTECSSDLDKVLTTAAYWVILLANGIVQTNEKDDAYLQTQLLIASKGRKQGIHFQDEELT
ncbi:hypothetical protein Tco_0217228 [Tanacetum coccineum]